MTHRSDDKHARLLVLTGEVTGAIDDLERTWLEAEVVAPLGNQINDLWLAYFLENGATSGEFNDAAFEYLLAVGATSAALPDMWAEAWRDGLIGSGAPLESGYEVELLALSNFDVDLASTVEFEVII
jgi:hypothetical protein